MAVLEPTPEEKDNGKIPEEMWSELLHNYCNVGHMHLNFSLKLFIDKADKMSSEQRHYSLLMFYRQFTMMKQLHSEQMLISLGLQREVDQAI